MTLSKLLSCGLALLMVGGTLTAQPAAEGETALLAGENAQPAPSDRPLKLVVGVNDVYCKDSSCKCIEQIATRQFGDFLAKLKAASNIDLEFVYIIEPYDLGRAFQEGKFDAVLCKPWLIFRNPEGRSESMARVADLQDLQGDPGFWGVVIVPKNSLLTKLGEISGKRIAYGQADAYEKHQGVLALFEREGVKPGPLTEKASCLECLDLLMKGSVDAAVISNYALTADCAVDVTTPDAWRVLGKTETIPLTSLMVDLKRVSREDALRLQKALTELTPLPATMSGGGFVQPVSWKVPRKQP